METFVSSSLDPYSGRNKRKRIETGNNSNVFLDSSCPRLAPQGHNYGVFLSFRGPETRHTFVSFLYQRLTGAGVRVFLDSEELRGGENIHPSLVEAIEKSRISIPIFSPDYASSKSCLQEVAKIFDCWRTRGQIVLPVFYFIEPSDVRNQTGPFAQSIHERQKEALREIGFFKGYTVGKDQDQGKIVEKITSEVMEWLRTCEVPVEGNLVGMEQRVEELVELLQVSSSDVRIVGISGMPGIGKTALAQSVYNKLHPRFEGCSFISGIRDGEPRSLQNMLIEQLLKRKFERVDSYEANIKFISNVFTNMRVLIVLDDVEDLAHLKAFGVDRQCFGSGSRIILTTQRPELLDEAKIEKKYTVNALSQPHALRLFLWHAFQKDSPEGEYRYLSAEIASRSGGIPLVIQLVGSRLSNYRNREKKRWNEVLQQLKNCDAEPMRKLLETTYDNLTVQQQQIYLDIACFLRGENNTIASYMWDDCKFYPIDARDKLVGMSLLTIGEKDEMLMNHPVSEYGRNLVLGEDNKPEMRSRLWIRKEALKVLEGEKGTDRIEAICLHIDNGNLPKNKKFNEGSDKCRTIMAQNFAGLTKLRFLRLDRAKIGGDLRKYLPELRWLDWKNCLEISEEVPNLSLENLVILDMSCSSVTEEWSGWKLITEKATKLKVLFLARCKDLCKCPEFQNGSLEILNFEYCPKLSSISISGTLKNLVCLNMRGCSNLTKLPEELSSMDALEKLIVDETAISEINVGSRMVNLQLLSAASCKCLQKIDKSIGELKSLLYLMLDHTPIAELPDSIGNLTSLVKLDLSDTLVAALPSSVERLKSLQVLLMKETYLKVFPEAVVKLVSLQNIDFSLCRSMKGKIPDGINSLSFLKTLMLSETKVTSLPANISELSQLQVLDLQMCENLQDFPCLPSSLSSLRMGIHSMTNIPDLSHMTNLEELHLADNSNEHPELATNESTLRSWPADSFRWITNLSKLEVLELHISKILDLPADFGGLQNLRKLVLSCWHLKCLPQLPSCLTTLHLQYYKPSSNMENFSNLESLSKLEIVHCAVKLINLTKLSKLLHLKIFDCCLEQIIGIDEFSCLEMFDMSNCSQFPIDDLWKLKGERLKVLLDGLEFHGNT